MFTLYESLRGDFLMTYDNADEVRALAERHGFKTKAVPMKNTHHAEMAELLIGRNLDWVEDGGIFREEAARVSQRIHEYASREFVSLSF